MHWTNFRGEGFAQGGSLFFFLDDNRVTKPLSHRQKQRAAKRLLKEQNELKIKNENEKKSAAIKKGKPDTSKSTSNLPIIVLWGEITISKNPFKAVFRLLLYNTMFALLVLLLEWLMVLQMEKLFTLFDSAQVWLGG